MDARPVAAGESRLAWRAFRARFFPETRKHDLAALEAYEAYADT